MATAQAYDGILAVTTVNDSPVSPRYSAQMSVDIIVVRGYSAPVRTATISIPLPTGCVAFGSYVSVAFIDDGSLVAGVIGSSEVDIVTAATQVNDMKAQLHKYRVTDDGQYELVWHGDESPFMSTGDLISAGSRFVPSSIVWARDCSWGAWGANTVDLGSGKVNWLPLTSYLDSTRGHTYLGFAPDYSYEGAGSSIANCLTRRPFLNTTGGMGLYEAVAFDGSVVRSVHWQSDAFDLPSADSDYQFTDTALFRAYQDSALNVAANYESLITGAISMRFATVDSDTYVPGAFGPLRYMADQVVGTSVIQRLPGGGYTASASTGEYVPLRRGADGYLLPSFASIPVVRHAFGIIYNGLAVNFTANLTGGGLSRNYTLAWADVDGNVTTWAASGGTLSNPPIGAVAFRPILSTDSISGVIDASRRLFTPV